MSAGVDGRVNGIDVSSIQGNINWQKVRDAGFEFAYIRCSLYSRCKDHMWEKNRDGALKAGLVVGAYHVTAHDTDPVAQAEHAFRSCGGHGSRPGELPLLIDWEFCTPSHYTPANGYPLGHPKHCVVFAEKFAARATELWYGDNNERTRPRYPVLYTYPWYGSAHQPALGASGLGHLPLCWANYKHATVNGKTVRVPWLPGPDQGPMVKVAKPWSTWTLWQYSGNEGLKVPGVIPDCDRQVFNGSSGEFAEFIGLHRPPHSTEGRVIEDEFPTARA